MPAGNQVVSVCNYNDSDICLVLHASKDNSDVVFVCKDTDVLILRTWVYSKLGVANNWYPKNILKIHALTGCDNALYFYQS